MIIISAPDTDVAVISCYQRVSGLESIDKIRLKSVVFKIKRYLTIHDITDKLGFSLIKLLPVIHSITS